MLEFRNVTKTYGGGLHPVPALSEINLFIEPGEFVAITGPSGCGKSTLLHLASGLDLPSEGEVIVEGRSTGSRSDDELTLMRRNRIGLIFQAFNLIPTLTALENVVLPTTLDGKSFSSQLAFGKSLLEQVDLADRFDHYPDQLSGGEAQRVAIARALIMNPLILLADEPTGNLDSESGKAIIELLEHFGSSTTESPTGPVRRSTLIVTHDEAIASRAPRRIRLKDGVLI
jgi:putative ABC transport system ATP-binding protein